MVVHNHGAEEGPGLSCNQIRLPNGQFKGACVVKKQPPKIQAPVKMNGKIVGKITINPDGTFEGELTDRLTHVLWASYLECGYSDSVSIYPNLIPAIEAGSPEDKD